MMRLMKHLDYWIGFKKVIEKIRKSASFWKQLIMCALCSTLIPFDTDGSRTFAGFKMELFGAKVNGWKLLLLLFHLICGRGCRSTSEKHRIMKIETIFSFSSVWVSLIISYSTML